MGWYYRRIVVPRVIEKCVRVITVSKYEAGRIAEQLKLSSEKLVAVYNGVSKHFTPVVTEAKNYIFFLGNTDPKKNTERVLRAYAQYLKTSDKKMPLLIADLNMQYVKELLEKSGIPEIIEKVNTPVYINNSDLPMVYSNAFVFLYPSLRESFGIPILEAMACGTPVVTSCTSAMPEIAGGAALLVDPNNEKEIAEAILKIENDKDIRENLINAGIKRSSGFSWEHTAKELLKIYKSI
ncbi:Alpha-maltose-1-phosphate synthase [bioreactor metagenome]|uniref:Alpha-maltose-1-phosphate synthase n=1 Tax=bioreactor metagenome TaxID=1076179 RepID=A0A645FV57_9ZZZZ